MVKEFCLKWRQLAHHQLMSQQGPQFSPHSKAKAYYKSINLRKIGNKWFKCCSVHFSSLRETRLKKLMNMIIIITSNRKIIY